MEQGPQHRATHAATRVTSLGTTSVTQHHPQQLPLTFIREDLPLRELPLQLPLQHRPLRRSYVSGINVRNFVASGLAMTSSRMSTSLHNLWSTVNIHLQLLVRTNADRSLVYL